MRDNGFDLVGGLADFDEFDRLCYVGGPEEIIVMLAESLARGSGTDELEGNPA